MLICKRCKKTFEDVKGFEDHNGECGSFGYEIIRQVKKVAQAVKTDKGAINAEPQPAKAHRTELKDSKESEKIAKTLGEKPAKKVGRPKK